MRIRCGDSFAIDLDQVVAWSKCTNRPGKRELLNLFLSGADDAICVYQDIVGCQAFALLHKVLLEQFAIDLAATSNLPCTEESDNCDDLVMILMICPTKLS